MKQILSLIAVLFFISMPAFAMDGNVLWLKFDDSSIDSSGLNQVVNEQNSVYGNGVFGKSKYFDGGSGGLVVVNTAPSLNFGTDDFSVSFWVSEEQGVDSVYVVGKASEDDYGWFAGKTEGSSQEGQWNKLSFDWKNETDNVHLETTTYAGSSGSWFHVVAERENGIYRLYVNGTLVDSIEAETINTDNSDDIQIGGKGESDFGGSVDEVQIWNFALSEDQIDNLMVYNSLTVPQSPSGMFFANTTKPIVLLLVAIGLGLFVFHKLREGEMDAKTMVGIMLTVLIGLAFIMAISGIA